MSKKLKYLFVIFNLMLMINTTICFAGESVKSGYYRLRNCTSDMYMEKSSSYLIQKKPVVTGLPQRFLLTTTDEYEGYYTIHPDSATYLGLRTDVQTSTSFIDIGFMDSQFWKMEYVKNGMFKFKSKAYGGYLTVGKSGLSTNGAKIYQLQGNTSGENKWFVEKAIVNGVYRIKNKATGKYLTATNREVKIADNTANYNQEFHLVMYTDGYVDIMPVENEGYSVSVYGWDRGLDNEGAYIRLEDGQSSEGQMWRFLANENGTLRIVSQLSDCSKCITAKGNYLYSCTFDDTNKYNQWELELVSSDTGDEKVCLIAGWRMSTDWESGGACDRRKFIPTMASYYKSHNTATKVKAITSFNANIMLNEMKNNNVVSISTHGTPDYLVGLNSNGYGTDNLNCDYINKNCKDGELKNLKICLLSGCSTAKGDSSITEKVFEKGARCVIGFGDTIYLDKAVDWDRAFNEIIAKGGNVELALTYADWIVVNKYSGNMGGMDTYEVYGNIDTRMNN